MGTSYRRGCAASLVLAVLAPGLTAQLILPADGQPAFAGSGWNGAGFAAVVVDLNADGLADFARSKDTKLQALLNNGHGVFAAGPLTTQVAMQSNYLMALAAGDVDGDGHTDVLGSATGNRIWIFAGDGTGSFGLGHFVTVDGPKEIALDDFDLDGALDVVAGAGSGSASVYTLPGHGDGSFGAPVAHGDDAGLMHVDAADWDLDGDADVLGGKAGFERVLLSDGAGAFVEGPSAEFSAGGFVRLADLNGDGWVDAINTAFELPGPQGEVVYIENVFGSFGPSHSTAAKADKGLAVERDPEDGFPDVVSGGDGAGSSSVVRLANTGGVLVPHTVFRPEQVDAVGIADFDGDGDSDVLAGDMVYFTAPSGLPVGAELYPSPVSGSMSAIVVGHLDGDVQPDAVLVDGFGDKLVVGKGQSSPAGPFGGWQWVSSADGPGAPVLVDANTDGSLDAVVLFSGSQGAGIAAHLGDGIGHLGAAQLSPAAPGPLTCAPADMDADGVPDLLVLNSVAYVSQAQIWRGLGTGLYAAAGSASLGMSLLSSVAAGDVNGDGFLDAVATLDYSQAGTLLAAAGDGAGQLAAPVVVPQQVSVFNDAVVADFDADGLQDIAAACDKKHGVALFRADGAGGFAAPVVGGIVDPYERGMLVADVDDDGALDLAYSSWINSSVYVVRGDGQGGLHSGTAHQGARGFAPRSVAAADFDLDGQTDLLKMGSDEGLLVLLRRLGSADNPWASIGGGIAGSAGQPRLQGTGEPVPGQTVHLDADHAAPGAPALLVAGLALLDQPFKGGHLVPVPSIVTPVGAADGSGELHLAGLWPATIPSGTEIWLQMFFPDPGAAHGLSATGGMRLLVP